MPNSKIDHYVVDGTTINILVYILQLEDIPCGRKLTSLTYY